MHAPAHIGTAWRCSQMAMNKSCFLLSPVPTHSVTQCINKSYALTKCNTTGELQCNDCSKLRTRQEPRVHAISSTERFYAKRDRGTQTEAEMDRASQEHWEWDDGVVPACVALGHWRLPDPLPSIPASRSMGLFTILTKGHTKACLRPLRGRAVRCRGKH